MFISSKHNGILYKLNKEVGVTYEAGWIERRITEAAQEYESLPDAFKDALKLETSPKNDVGLDVLQTQEEA